MKTKKRFGIFDLILHLGTFLIWLFVTTNHPTPTGIEYFVTWSIACIFFITSITITLCLTDDKWNIIKEKVEWK